MKFTQAILCALMLAVMPTEAGTACISWDANPESDVIGYRVHYGTASRIYTEVIDVGNETRLAVSLPVGTHFINVTAYNDAGLESNFGAELVFDMPEIPFEPVGGIAIRVVEIQVSSDLKNWTLFATVPAGEPPFFVRAVTKENLSK